MTNSAAKKTFSVLFAALLFQIWSAFCPNQTLLDAALTKAKFRAKICVFPRFQMANSAAIKAFSALLFNIWSALCSNVCYFIQEALSIAVQVISRSLIPRWYGKEWLFCELYTDMWYQDSAGFHDFRPFSCLCWQQMSNSAARPKFRAIFRDSGILEDLTITPLVI